MTDPDAEPSYEDIAEWSASITGYWKVLAAKLKLPIETVDNIAKSLPLYPTVKDQALQMLKEWRETGNATYRKMAEALRTLNKGGLADKICPPQRDSLGKAQHKREHSPSVTPAANSGERSKRTKTGSPSDEELNDLADKIPLCWYSLAIRLGLPVQVVDKIDGNIAHQDPVRKVFQALVDWRGRFGTKATYEKLAVALEKVGRRDLVDEFCIDQMDQKARTWKPQTPQGSRLEISDATTVCAKMPSDYYPETQSGEDSSGQHCSDGQKTHLLILAKTWGCPDSSGEISGVTKEMAQQFIKHRNVKVSYLALNTTAEQQSDAKQVGIDLHAVERTSGSDDLFVPPKAVGNVHAVVSCGKAVGQQVQIVKLRFDSSRTVHFACSSTEDANPSESTMCEDFDLVFGIGSGVADHLAAKLSFRNKDVHLFTPGIFKEFYKYEQTERESETFRVVVFYPPKAVVDKGDEIQMIPAKAVGALSGPGNQYELIAICAPGDDPDKLKDTLKQHGITPGVSLVVRCHCGNVEVRRVDCSWRRIS